MGFFSRRGGSPSAPQLSAVWTMATDAETRHAQRLSRYRRNYLAYRGELTPHTRGDDSPPVKMNYLRALVNAQVDFLFLNGFTTTIPDDPTTSGTNEYATREFVRHALKRHWDDNYAACGTLNTLIGQAGAIYGDVFLRVSWEDGAEYDEPFARVDVLPSRHVFPEFGGPDGLDARRVRSVLVIYPTYISDDAGLSGVSGVVDGDRDSVIIRAERWYPDRVEYWDHANVTTPRVVPNPLGEIPIVHIANYPSADDVYGVSDIEDVTDLQIESNAKHTDISDVINYHGSPVTVVTGARIGQIDIGADRLWAIPADSKIQNLALSGELNASMEYLKVIRKSMHELSSVPEGALGGMDPTGLTGVSLALKYMPMLNRRTVKADGYRRGLERVNRLMLKLIDLVDDEFHRKFSVITTRKYRTEVSFPSPLPRDESLELDRAGIRLTYGLSTRRAEIERLGYSQAQVEEIYAGWLKEKEELAEIEMKVGAIEDPFVPDQANRSGNPNPSRSNPAARGEAKSTTAETTE